MNHQDTKTPRRPESDEQVGEGQTIGSHRKPHAPIPEELNRIAHEVVDAAFVVHSTLGPGLLESVYETCLAFELGKRGLSVRRQVDVPVRYAEMTLDAALRIDLLVEDALVVETKAVESLHPVYTAQLLTYLKLTGRRLGLLINFNVPSIRDGIKRIAL